MGEVIGRNKTEKKRITPSEQIWQKGMQSMSQERLLEQSHILSTFLVYGNWVDLDSEVWVNPKFQIIEFSLYHINHHDKYVVIFWHSFSFENLKPSIFHYDRKWCLFYFLYFDVPRATVEPKLCSQTAWSLVQASLAHICICFVCYVV